VASRLRGLAARWKREFLMTTATGRPARTDERLPHPAPADTDDDMVAEGLLVEEVSIDGMCGVY
jgi:mycofactocin precursor